MDPVNEALHAQLALARKSTLATLAALAEIAVNDVQTAAKQPTAGQRLLECFNKFYTDYAQLARDSDTEVLPRDEVQLVVRHETSPDSSVKLCIYFESAEYNIANAPRICEWEEVL